MRAWHLIANCILLQAAYASPLSAADPPPDGRRRASLVYERVPGTEHCPDASALRRAVETHLGYAPFVERAPLEIRCRIVVSGARLRASVKVSDNLSGHFGERKLVAPHASCNELTDALALAIAIAIDPLLPAANAAADQRAPVVGSSPDRGGPTAEGQDASSATSTGEYGSARTTPTSEDAHAHAPAATVADDEGRAPSPSSAVLAAPDQVTRAKGDQPDVPIVFSIGGGPAFAYALQPTAVMGMSLGFALRRGAWSVELDVDARAPSHVAYATGTVTAQLFSFSLAACLHGRNLNACALGDGGFIDGAGEGFLRSTRDRTPYAATGLRLGWHQPIAGNWSTLLYAAAVVPAVRTTLWIDSEPVWTMPPIAARLGILGFFAFP